MAFVLWWPREASTGSPQAHQRRSQRPAPSSAVFTLCPEQRSPGPGSRTGSEHGTRRRRPLPPAAPDGSRLQKALTWGAGGREPRKGLRHSLLHACGPRGGPLPTFRWAQLMVQTHLQEPVVYMQWGGRGAPPLESGGGGRRHPGGAPLGHPSTRIWHHRLRCLEPHDTAPQGLPGRSGASPPGQEGPGPSAFVSLAGDEMKGLLTTPPFKHHCTDEGFWT